MRLFEKFDVIKEGIERPLGDKEGTEARRAALDEEKKQIESETASMRPSYYFKERRSGMFGGERGGDLDFVGSPGEGSDKKPWLGQTTKDPLKDFERLLPGFMHDQDAVDGFVTLTFRRLAMQHIPKDRAKELMERILKRLRERGEI